ncbi:hypothetical protein CEV31_2069 [Brucella thiophenivorans]|uniref:Uncharacterized protein n=1 Tax=Brucella thiophenivorans TaxID=571255 RepID=A0A256FV33_9HYPH|nr:hypothetical protein CEV31_2069 [Brucella thiophenivorans]
MTATRRRMYNSINFIGGVYIPVQLKKPDAKTESWLEN